MTICRKILIREWLAVVLMIVVGCLFSGCAAGYYSYQSSLNSIESPASNVTDIKISFAANDPLMLISLEKTLRACCSSDNLNKIEDKNFQHDPERILIRGDFNYHDPSSTTKIWTYVSFFSLSVIPAIIEQPATINFKVVAPNGNEKTFQYDLNERFYNWLPFLFFSPDFFYVFMNGKDDDRKKSRALDGITARFIVDATPFIIQSSR